MMAVALTAAPARTKVAHIGLELDGSWSWIGEVLQEPTAELVGIADAHEELRARAGKAAPGARLYADWVRMLDELRPAAVTATVDTTAPTETISSTIVTDTGLTGTIASGGLTKDNTLGLSGTAEAGSSVAIYDGTNLLGTVVAFAGVNFALRHLTAGQAGLFGMLEPVLASIIAWLVLGENLLVHTLCGVRFDPD